MHGDNEEGAVLCAWCGAVMGWAGETVYSLCKACVPLVREAVMARRRIEPFAAADDEPLRRPSAG